MVATSARIQNYRPVLRCFSLLGQSTRWLAFGQALVFCVFCLCVPMSTLFAEEPLPLTMAAHQKRCDRGQNKISTALRQENWVDAHLMAEVMDVFCDDLQSKPWKISNAISLIRLDDGDSARVILRELMASSETCLLYTSPSPRDATLSRMPSSA